MSALSDLTVGDSGVVVALDLPESVQNHLMHMGFVPDAEVKALRRAPAGDPTVYRVDGLEIALRRETASAIQVRPAEVLPAEAAVEVRSVEVRSVEAISAEPAAAPDSDSTESVPLAEAAR